jgi:drug/metabolite transporter (DMT)-like permease
LTAALLALTSSLVWGFADFFGGLKSRTLGVLAVMLVSQLVGTTLIGTAVILRAEAPHDARVLLAVPASIAGTLGLVAFYRGMKIGAISIVAPIAGLAAVVPVIYGIATGDRPSPAQLAGMALALAGVVLASREPGRTSRVATGAGLALLSAVGFGCYFPLMHAASSADSLWATMTFRIVSTSIVCAAAVLVRPSLRLSRGNLVAVAAIGVFDMLGNLLFALASPRGLVSVVSVLASLYPVVTVALAAVVLRERIAPSQRLGVGAALAGVVLLSAG